MPTVSVIIPAYNRETTILRAIDSVFAQTYSDFEILVVDDCSSDGTIRAVEALSDPRVKVIRREQNGGAPAARNTGIQAATGKYIALLDSDDEWLPEKLQIQLAQLQQNPNAMASCTAILQDDGVQIREYHPRMAESWHKKALMDFDLSMGSTFLGQRSVFTQVGLFDENLRRYEDPDWLINYCKQYDLCFIDRPLSKVSIGHRPSPEIQEQAALLLIKKHQDDFKYYGWWFQHRCLARLWLEIAWGYHEAGQKDLWKRYFLKTIFNNPFQYPGLYLLFADSLLGTQIFSQVQKIKRAWIRS